LASHQPANTAIRLPTKLANTLTDANVHCPDSARRNVSSEKAENVVKPPNTPVIRNSCALADTDTFVISQVPNVPAIKHPNILAERVGHGNRAAGASAKEMPYRIDAPIAPPAATLTKDTMDGIGTELAFWIRGLYRKTAQQ